MLVNSRKRLVEFWESRKHDAEIAKRDLTAWFKVAEKAAWPNFGALKQTFGSADAVGNCVVFDVGNNRFRLIGRVIYPKGRLYVLKVMDHREYDKGRWEDECGCHQPPPKRAAAGASKSPATGKRKRRVRKRGK